MQDQNALQYLPAEDCIHAGLPDTLQLVRMKKKGKWSPDEDKLLRSLYKKHDGKWKAISKEIVGRSSRKCRRRWTKLVYPSVVNDAWTPDEDKLLKELHDDVGDMWAVIGKHLEGRTDVQCRRRWKALQGLHDSPLVRSGTTRPLTSDEDRAIGDVQCADADELEPSRADEQTPTRKRTRRTWTPEEDRLLAEMHDKHGNAWASISVDIPGRTDLACRQRWVNVLDPAVKKGAWTCEEDDLLKSLHNEHGDGWAKICAGIPGRNYHSCRSRWVNFLDPTLQKGEWTVEEDRLLEELREEHGDDFAKISAGILGRTSTLCRKRWYGELLPQKQGKPIKKSFFTHDEDRLLKELHAIHGDNWAEISARLPGRTERRCRERYSMSLGPTVKHGRWTPEEDSRLTELKAVHGNKWSRMAAEMPGRTGLQCSHRWEVLDPSSKRGVWTDEETRRLVELRDEHGDSWEVIGEHMPGRSAQVCREFWLRKLNPNIERRAFTPEEDNRLIELHAVHGNQWRLISQSMPGRSGVQCCGRFCHELDPTLNKGPWSADEDRRLAELHAVRGNKWVQIARELPGRSGYLCRERWRRTSGKRNKTQDGA